jgi:hypothetical protein
LSQSSHHFEHHSGLITKSGWSHVNTIMTRHDLFNSIRFQFVSSWIYQSASKKVSLSTSDTKIDNEALIMNNVTAIQLNFQKVALNDIPNKVMINVDIQILT